MFPELWKIFTWAKYWGQIAVWWSSWPPFWCIHSLFYRTYFILLALRWQFWLREAIFPAVLPYCSRVTSRVTNYANLCKVTTSYLSCHDRKRFIFYTWQSNNFSAPLPEKFLLSNSNSCISLENKLLFVFRIGLPPLSFTMWHIRQRQKAITLGN